MNKQKLSELWDKLWEGIKTLHKRGFFHIIAGSTLAKIAGFVSVFFLPRFLSKADYGLLTYVENIRNYVMLFNGIGITNATLRFCAQQGSDEEKKGYFVASLKIGIFADVFLIVLTTAAFLVIPFPYEGARFQLVISSCLPIFYFLFTDIQLLLRATFQNQRYSVYNFTYSFLLMIFQIVFAVLWGVTGVMIGKYLSMALCVLMGYLLIRDLPMMKVKAIKLDWHEIKTIIRFGIVMLTASATSTVMSYNETFIVGQLLKDEELLAEYRVAANILSISLFLLEALLVFILPYFIQHIKDKQWIWENYKKLFVINGTVMTLFHLGLFIFAKLYLFIFAGPEYMGAVSLVRMFLVASWIQAVFRGISGNILAVTGEEKFNLKINIVFVVVHAVIDIAAVSLLGIYGAAIALIVVYFLSGLIMNIHLRNICKNRLER
ncbi:oligosaccharide flippase family protein [uncultured Negativibacillus sp.]|uniref:oligosaccharide flippase family protein n=1 Tax=uncultured Negativibacillus sp. TaxID=1980696 RepID=UPI0025CF3CF7|nr:oligosaccharide flippase family protein [uncultured Negativibacillus sp.]